MIELHVNDTLSCKAPSPSVAPRRHAEAAGLHLGLQLSASRRLVSSCTSDENLGHPLEILPGSSCRTHGYDFPARLPEQRPTPRGIDGKSKRQRHSFQREDAHRVFPTGASSGRVGFRDYQPGQSVRKDGRAGGDRGRKEEIEHRT